MVTRPVITFQKVDGSRLKANDGMDAVLVQTVDEKAGYGSDVAHTVPKGGKAQWNCGKLIQCLGPYAGIIFVRLGVGEKKPVALA